jgi:hypothetical protein
MLGNLRNAFLWKDSLATRFFMWSGRMFYQVPQDFDVREFWALTEDRKIPKPSDISDQQKVKALITLNRFRFEFISDFGRWLVVVTAIIVSALSILIGFGNLIKHLF